VRGGDDRPVSVHPTQADGRVRDRRDYGEAPVRPEEVPASTEAGAAGSDTPTTGQAVGLASGGLEETVEGLHPKGHPADVITE
jgi:hypothetical protein